MIELIKEQIDKEESELIETLQKQIYQYAFKRLQDGAFSIFYRIKKDCLLKKIWIR